MTLTNSTVSGNSTAGAYADGGGIYGRLCRTLSQQHRRGQHRHRRHRPRHRREHHRQQRPQHLRQRRRRQCPGRPRERVREPCSLRSFATAAAARRQWRADPDHRLARRARQPGARRRRPGRLRRPPTSAAWRGRSRPAPTPTSARSSWTRRPPAHRDRRHAGRRRPARHRRRRPDPRPRRRRPAVGPRRRRRAVRRLGSDVLAGGPGLDRMTGGAGADRFVLRQPEAAPPDGPAYDEILDFSRVAARPDRPAADRRQDRGRRQPGVRLHRRRRLHPRRPAPLRGHRRRRLPGQRQHRPRPRRRLRLHRPHRRGAAEGVRLPAVGQRAVRAPARRCTSPAPMISAAPASMRRLGHVAPDGEAQEHGHGDAGVAEGGDVGELARAQRDDEGGVAAGDAEGRERAQADVAARRAGPSCRRARWPGRRAPRRRWSGPPPCRSRPRAGSSGW